MPWLLLACVGALVVACVALRDRWQQWWFELEDPRSIAVFRIVFAFLLICNVNGLAEWFHLLFLPEGMFTGAEARAAFASGEGIQPFSLLYFWDEPIAPWIVLALFEICAFLFMVGLHTRVAGVLTLVLVDTIFTRNFVFWEGTDVVFRVFLVYLVCARCGHAYSVDDWLRRRRGTPFERRLVPAWPRRLMMVQVSILFVTTGLLKHGGAWIDGDAVYYALTNDHYARFALEGGLAGIGDGTLAALTWFARSAEVFFPFALVGIIGRWSAATFPPLDRRRHTIVVGALLVALACSALVVHATGAPRLLPVAAPGIAVASWIVVLGGTGIAWATFRTHPDLARWLFGRRIWIAAAALLLLGMWLLMNIGWFHPVMLATLIPFFAAEQRATAPLAYSPRVRSLGGVLLGWHVLAIGVVVLPHADETAALRSRAGVLVGPWLAATRMQQTWGMWSVPPRENVFLKAVVIDHGGVAHPLPTDLHDADHRPPSPLGYDRWWKIAARIVNADASSPYPAAYAGWLCRTHPEAESVELRAVTYPIPTPNANRRAGGHDSAQLLREAATERTTFTTTCR